MLRRGLSALVGAIDRGRLIEESRLGPEDLAVTDLVCLRPAPVKLDALMPGHEAPAGYADNECAKVDVLLNVGLEVGKSLAPGLENGLYLVGAASSLCDVQSWQMIDKLDLGIKQREQSVTGTGVERGIRSPDDLESRLRHRHKPTRLGFDVLLGRERSSPRSRGGLGRACTAFPLEAYFFRRGVFSRPARDWGSLRAPDGQPGSHFAS